MKAYLFQKWNTQMMDKIHNTMKKIFFTIIIAVLFTFYACDKEPDSPLVVSFTGLNDMAEYCLSDDAVLLTGSPTNGSFSAIAGLTDNLDGTATFNPSVAGAGDFEITYTAIDDENNESISEKQTVKVNDGRDKNVVLEIKEQIGGEAFSPETTYTNSLNQSYKVEKLIFYLSNVKLVAEDGTEELMTEVLLHNYTEAEDLKFTVPEGKYTGIKFGFGLDSDLNMTDPTTVAEDSPLHTDRDMYWVWATMYRFIKLEGRASSEANATELTDAFLYHIGTNPYYQEVTLTRDIIVDNCEEANVSIVLNIDEIFDNSTTPVDVINENSTHTMNNPDLATKVKNNLVEAFE